jgi:CBS domain-containing protein
VLRDYPVAATMNKDVETVLPTDTLREAVRRIGLTRYGCLVAIDENRGPVGILTAGDLYRLLLSEQAPTAAHLRHILSSPEALVENLRSARAVSGEEDDHVVRYMSTPVVTIDVSRNLNGAAELFDEHIFRQFPVVQDGRLVGLIRRVDLLEPLMQAHEEAQRRQPPDTGTRGS